MEACFLKLGSSLDFKGSASILVLDGEFVPEEVNSSKEFSFDASIVCVFEAKRLASKMLLKFAIHFGSPEFVFSQEALLKKNAKLYLEYLKLA